MKNFKCFIESICLGLKFAKILTKKRKYSDDKLMAERLRINRRAK